MKVMVSNMTEARRLTEATNLCDCPIDAVTGSRSCDAKSLLGILSLDITNEIELVFHCDEKDKEKYENIVSDRY